MFQPLPTGLAPLVGHEVVVDEVHPQRGGVGGEHRRGQLGLERQRVAAVGERGQTRAQGAQLGQRPARPAARPGPGLKDYGQARQLTSRQVGGESGPFAVPHWEPDYRLSWALPGGDWSKTTS